MKRTVEESDLLDLLYKTRDELHDIEESLDDLYEQELLDFKNRFKSLCEEYPSITFNYTNECGSIIFLANLKGQQIKLL